MNIKRSGSLFFSGILLGFVVFIGATSVAARAQAAPVPLGNQIVCFVFTNLNSFGSPIPHLASDGCSSGEVPQSQTGVLVVKKVVRGGPATANQFSFSINEGIGITFNANGENDFTIATNTSYTVSETATSTYTPSYNNCSSVTVNAGATSTCTIINTYIPPEVTPPPVSISDLSIAKTVSTSTPPQGGTITYTLTVHNAGPDVAQHVSVTDLLPAGLTYVSSSGTYSSTTGIWSAGTVGTTSDVSLHIVATVTALNGIITNTANITAASSTDPNSANNTSTVSITPAATSTPTNGGTSGGNGGGNEGGGGGDTNTPPPGGGGSGGGGIVSGPLSYGYGGGGGLVLGTSTGEVLGASTSSCSLYLTDYLRIGHKNNAEQVTKLQTFLNSHLGIALPVTGFFGPLTDAAVRKFQAQYAADVLTPWVPYGLVANETTGYVYKTTLRKINLIMCNTLNLPAPILP